MTQEIPPFKAHFLRLSRKEMVEDILYDNGRSPAVVDCKDSPLVWKCEKYLELFDKNGCSYLGSKLSKEKIVDIFNVKFILAMTHLNNNNGSRFGLELLETICCDVRCPQQIMDWSLYNYGHFTGFLQRNLQTDGQKRIPKIIHMIFFGETPLEPQHVRSVVSVLEHMCKPGPNRKKEDCYKLYFHTCFDNGEPKLRTHNAWQQLVSYDNFVVKPIEAPEEIDGFPLKYVQYKADIARIEVLKQHGGVYIDCDILLTKAFDELLQQAPDCHGITPTFFICEEGPRSEEQKKRAIPNEQILNAFLACSKDHPVLELWLDETKGRIREGEWAYHIRLNEFIWLQNPCALAKYEISVLENKHFFAHGWQKTALWAADEKLEPTLDEYGYHMWNTISAGNGLKGSSILPGCEYVDNVTYRNLAENVILISTTESIQKRVSTIRVLREMGYTTRNIHICMSNRHSNPIYGCRQAHVDAIRKAKEIGCGSVLIVEDDISFNPKTITDNVLKQSVDVVANDWDVLYLGGILTRVDEIYGKQRSKLSIHHSDTRSSARWVRGQVWCNHAYIVKRHMFDVIISAVSRMEKHFASKIDNVDQTDSAWKGFCGQVNIDHVYANMLSSRFKFYLCAQMPIIQCPELSRFDKTFDWDVWSLKHTGQSDPFTQLNIEWESI